MSKNLLYLLGLLYLFGLFIIIIFFIYFLYYFFLGGGVVGGVVAYFQFILSFHYWLNAIITIKHGFS